VHPPIQACQQRGISRRHLFVNEKSCPAKEQCFTSFTSQTFLGDPEGKGALRQLVLMGVSKLGW